MGRTKGSKNKPKAGELGSTIITQKMSPAAFQGHLKVVEDAPLAQARYMVKVTYRRFTRKHEQFVAKYQGEFDEKPLGIETVKKFFKSPKVMLEWVDSFPRDLVVKGGIEVHIL